MVLVKLQQQAHGTMQILGSGGAGGTGNNTPSSATGGHGGKGVVILSVPLMQVIQDTTTGSPTVAIRSVMEQTKVLAFTRIRELHSIMASHSQK
jgi:hypothetical protein